MSKRKNIIRVGDYVKIITPNVFERCGYPLTSKIVIDAIITKEQRDAVAVMLDAFGVKQRIPSFSEKLTKATLSEQIMYLMAKQIMRQKGWGGPERSIYHNYVPELLNVPCRVISKRVVKTGTYNHGTSYQGYFDDYPEYEPAYLSNEHCHVLLKVYVSEPIPTVNPTEFEIERQWVELIPKEEF